MSSRDGYTIHCEYIAELTEHCVGCIAQCWYLPQIGFWVSADPGEVPQLSRSVCSLIFYYYREEYLNHYTDLGVSLHCKNYNLEEPCSLTLAPSCQVAVRYW